MFFYASPCKPAGSPGYCNRLFLVFLTHKKITLMLDCSDSEWNANLLTLYSVEIWRSLNLLGVILKINGIDRLEAGAEPAKLRRISSNKENIFRDSPKFIHHSSALLCKFMRLHTFRIMLYRKTKFDLLVYTGVFSKKRNLIATKYWLATASSVLNTERTLVRRLGPSSRLYRCT